MANIIRYFKMIPELFRGGTTIASLKERFEHRNQRRFGRIPGMLGPELRQNEGYNDGPRGSLRSREGRGGSRQSNLVAMLRQRHPDALRTVMDKYNDKLFAVANRICRNPADSEEVLQDVYMTALNKIDSFEERSSLSTWLYRITVNAALMKLRAQRTSKSTVPLDLYLSNQVEEEMSGETHGFQKSPLEGLVSRELHREIQKAVGTLPEIYRAVFLLRDINGYSIKETSRILKTTPAAIKSRLHRSRQYLRERLKNSYMYN